MSAEFDKVSVRIGYATYYANIEDATKILQLFSSVSLLKVETNYSAKPPVEVAVPIEDGYVTIQNADPGKALARILAGEAMINKE